MKFEETIKLQNFREHYSIILGNINIANSELERILKEKEFAGKDIDSLNGKVSDLRTELEDLKKEKTRVLTETDNKIRELDKKEKVLSKREIDVAEYESSTLRNLEKNKITLSQEISDAESQLNLLNIERDTLDKSISILYGQVSNLSSTSKDITAEVKELRVKQIDLLKTIKDKEDEFNGLLKVRGKELKEVEKQIEDSRAKVLDTDNHFAQKEKDIARRENDVLVITRRLRTLFQEVKPGIALKI